MLAKGKGSIINIASTVGASKAAPNRMCTGDQGCRGRPHQGTIAPWTSSARASACNTASAPGTIETPSLQERVKALGSRSAARRRARKMFHRSPAKKRWARLLAAPAEEGDGARRHRVSLASDRLSELHGPASSIIPGRRGFTLVSYVVQFPYPMKMHPILLLPHEMLQGRREGNKKMPQTEIMHSYAPAFAANLSFLFTEFFCRFP
jgi:hypothetical protein